MEDYFIRKYFKPWKNWEKVTVKNGYGRNFLLKQGKALRFSKENENLVNKKKLN